MTSTVSRNDREPYAFFRRAAIVIEPVTEAQAQVVRQGPHPATAFPMPFKGNDFGKTDVMAAL
jgi:hypothetical protein